jgi:hypothetical protein
MVTCGIVSRTQPAGSEEKHRTKEMFSKKMGLAVTSTKGEDGERTYSIKA